MNPLSDFANNLDLYGLLALLISAVAALICITFHELSHGFVAYRLGDPTAKNMGRLTLNPIKHIDLTGLIMMIVVKVGWAKPVPVDMRYFKNPKRDMAITALAGPISNFIMSIAALLFCSLLYHVFPVNHVTLVLLCFFSNVALLSTGLGIFNLIPISPLDGSKVLFALLPDKIYFTILRYEKYVMGLLIVLTLLGAFQRPLSFLINGMLQGLCAVTGFPLGALYNCLDISYILRMFF